MNLPPNPLSVQKTNSFWNKVPTIVGWICIVSSVFSSGLLIAFPEVMDKIAPSGNALIVGGAIHGINFLKIVLGILLIKKVLWASASLFFLQAADVGYAYYTTGSTGSFALTFLAFYFLAARCVYDYHLSPKVEAK